MLLHFYISGNWLSVPPIRQHWKTLLVSLASRQYIKWKISWHSTSNISKRLMLSCGMKEMWSWTLEKLWAWSSRLHSKGAEVQSQTNKSLSVTTQLWSRLSHHFKWKHILSICADSRCFMFISMYAIYVRRKTSVVRRNISFLLVLQ
jgi:hypothetical protein